VNDVHESRKASSLRLLNFWAQLGERYNRPLDEDDVIDLRDNSLVKDRGILRSAPTTYKVGCFAGDELPSDVNDASSDGGGIHTEDDYDDVDEIDAFAPEANISDELELEKEKLQVPRVQKLGPADTEDLREFLEAEQKRKELYGDLDEDDEETFNLRSLESGGDIEGLPETGDDAVESDIDKEGELLGLHGSEDEKDEHDDEDPGPSFSPRLASDNDSDDEFATWDFDSSTPMKRTAPYPRPSATEDIIDLTSSPLSSPSHSPADKSTGRGNRMFKPPVRPPSTARARSVPRSKPPSRRRSSMPPPPVPLPRPPVQQLLTPPLSSSSVVESTPEIVEGCDPTRFSASPSPSPSPPPRPKPRPRYKGATSVTSGDSGNSSHAIMSSLPRLDLAKSTDSPGRMKSASKEVLIPEVVIIRRSKSAGPAKSLWTKKPPLAPDNQDGKPTDNREENAVVEPVVPRKNKGKQREATSVEDLTASHTEKQGIRPIAGAGSRIVRSESPTYLEDPPHTTRSSRGRKRKRVISSSPQSEQSSRGESHPRIGRNSPSRLHRASTLGPPASQSKSDGVSERTPASSPLNSDAESDDDVERFARPPSRGHSRTPYTPSTDANAPPYMPPPSYHLRHGEQNVQYASTLPTDPQAVAQIAQLVGAYLLNAATGHNPVPGYPAAYPSPYSMQVPQWLPWTPTHRHRRSQRRDLSEMPSSDAASSFSSIPATPAHPHRYPYSFHPAFSGATLPPSSPPDSSGPSSPTDHSSPVARGRSKSKGRRVSFKLDDDDKPAPPKLPALDHEELSEASNAVQLRSRRGHGAKLHDDRPAVKNKGILREPSVEWKDKSAKSKKAKDKTRADDVSDSSSSEDLSVPARRGGRRHERGRTPGPQQERSSSALNS